MHTTIYKHRKISYFRGNYFFLSNFYLREIKVDNYCYPSVEHYFQAQKTENPKEFLKILSASSPVQARKLGKRCTLKPNWDKIKINVMAIGLRAKFTQHEDLKNKLLNTGITILEENNSWGDIFWGISNGQGENNLGRLLMKIRNDLKKR